MLIFGLLEIVISYIYWFYYWYIRHNKIILKLFRKYVVFFFYMHRSYSDYIDIIDKVENIEQGVITDNRCKKVCYFVLELIKFATQYIKNININIDGKKEKE